jgi:HD superfamily phosphodiesterase
MAFRFKLFGFELELSVNNTVAEDAERFVRKLLKDKLTPAFTFHNLQHTLNVTSAALQLCDLERCTALEREIVRLAALFHDTGFTRLYNNHEEESVHIAYSFLSKEKYPSSKLEQVLRCIRATRAGVIADQKIEMILQDADLAHLGNENYFDLLDNLRNEVALQLDKTYGDKEWLESNLTFLQQHYYKTYSAKMLWDKKKEEHIQRNKQLLLFL